MSNNVMEYYDNLIPKPKKIYIVINEDDLDGSYTIEKSFFQRSKAWQYINKQEEPYTFRVIETEIE